MSGAKAVPLSLADRVAIVTGAGRGIGRGIAKALAREGASVVAVDRDESTADDCADEIRSDGHTAVARRCDVGLCEDVAGTIEWISSEFGRIDILVNNAQALRAQVPLEDHTDDDFELAVRSGLWGTFHTMRAVFPTMRDQGGGRIVNFASSAGTHGQPGLAAYAAAKEGIRGLTKVAANEWGRHQICVNVICPSAASPGAMAWAAEHPDLFDEALRRVPLGRLGDPETDIGAAVVYLAGPGGSFITGQTLMVNGGATIMP